MQSTPSPHPITGERPERLRHILGAGVCALLVFGLCAVPRAHLIPRHGHVAASDEFLTGDEPSYLLMAHALARGDGLNVRPVSERTGYRAFQERPVLAAPTMWTWNYHCQMRGFRPWFDRSAVWGDAQILQFPPLLPALIAPWVYWTDHLRWRMACAQAAAVSLAGFLLLLAFRPSQAGQRLHAGVSLVFGLGSLPIAYYTTQMFPETLTGLLLLAACCLYARPGGRTAALVPLLLSLWATPRALGAVAAATLWIGWQAWRQRRWLDGLLLGIGWAAYGGFHLYVWGVPVSPQALSLLGLLRDHAYAGTIQHLLVGLLISAGVVTAAGLAWRRNRHRPWIAAGAVAGVLGLTFVWPSGFLSLFLANHVGLFFLSPVMVVAAAAAVVVLTFHRREEDLFWLCVFGGTLLALAGYPELRAGSCPAGRYQVAPAYLLLFPFLRLWAETPTAWTRRLTPVMYGLGVLGLAMAWSLARHPNFWYRRHHPLFDPQGYPWLHPFYEWLPDPTQASFAWKAGLWLVAFAALFFVSDLIRRIWRALTERRLGSQSLSVRDRDGH